MLFFSLTALAASLALAVITYAVARTFLIDQRASVARTQAFANAKVVNDQLLADAEQVGDIVSLLRTAGGGFAKAEVVALDSANGAIEVLAAAVGAPIATRFDLFARRLTATHAAPLLQLSIANATDAVPPLVPFLVLASLPGSPTIQTALGPFCIDPTYVGALFLEDGTGLVGGVSVSGQGGIGAPGLTRQYTVPPGLAGLQVRFQALGLDALSGWFKTNCEQLQF